MDLLQILCKDIPQKRKVLDRVQHTKDADLSIFFLHLIKKAKRQEKNIFFLNIFFMELYDAVYPYIIYDRVKVAKKIVRIMEELAMPIKGIGIERWQTSLKKVRMIKL